MKPSKDYKKDNYESAISDFNNSIRLDSRKSYAYYNRGLTYSMLKDDTKAIADFTKTIELKADDGAAYKMRAKIYCTQGLKMSALKDENKAISLGAALDKRCTN